MKFWMYPADTIVAPATAPGTGAVAIVRLSGPRAFEILGAIFRPAHPGELTPRPMRLGDIVDPATGARIDRALAVAMRQPASLTGEDVAEMQCHGGSFLVRRIITIAIDVRCADGPAGRIHPPRLPEWPNGFSRGRGGRRYNHRTQRFRPRRLRYRNFQASYRSALQICAVKLSRFARIWRSKSIFPRKTSASRRVAKSPQKSNDCIGDVAILHDSFARGLLMREGVRATIVGKPNAGKSSLMNLLLGADRAIVTAIAGTTRDVIEDSVQLGPYALVLNDTAGVRDTTDDIERIGIERTMRSARDADLLIAMFDSSRPLESADIEVIRLTAGRAGLAVLNKRDLPAAIGAADLGERGLSLPILPLSAIDPDEAAALRAELTKAIAALPPPAPPLFPRTPRVLPEHADSSNDQIAISRERHRDALAMALGALKNAAAPRSPRCRRRSSRST